LYSPTAGRYCAGAPPQKPCCCTPLLLPASRDLPPCGFTAAAAGARALTPSPSPPSARAYSPLPSDPPPTFPASLSPATSSQRYKFNLKQANFVKPGYHFMGSSVETRRFQAAGHNCSQLVQPHLVLLVHLVGPIPYLERRAHLRQQPRGRGGTPGGGVRWLHRWTLLAVSHQMVL
jgi:hypothetical protein